MKYYESVGPVHLSNPEAIAQFHIPMRWKGEPISKRLHLGVLYSEARGGETNIWQGEFLVYGVIFDDFKNSPFRKATLLLEGKCAATGKDAFAILVLDLDNDPNCGKKVTFSPVPFGSDGKAVLPKHLRSGGHFFSVVGIILRSKNSWTPRSVAEEMRGRYHLKDLEFNTKDALFLIQEMVRLGLASQHNTDAELYKRTMDEYRFMEVFDLRGCSNPDCAPILRPEVGP